MKYFFNYLIFPGFVFTLFLGILASWFERKITARVQWRVGPPLLQPLYDVLKLFFVKEVIIPEGVSLIMFILVPLLSFSSVLLASIMLGNVLFGINNGFSGDVIVITYLLTIPSLCVVLAGAVSKNPLASLGASREMKLILSYELVFWFLILVVIIKTGGRIRLNQIIEYQKNFGMNFISLSGIIAFIISIIVMQAKLGKVPFDIAEAETEIIAGPYIEYSGALLGIFRLTQYMLLVVLPFFIMSLFLGKFNLIKYLLLLLIIILIENTNPRIKINQAIRLFWFYLFPLGIISLILAIIGRISLILAIKGL